MMTWIAGNVSTILVAFIVLGLVALVLRKMIKEKKRGITSCGTSCSGCAMAGSCKEFDKKEK